MTNDEGQMTKEIRSSNVEGRADAAWPVRHSGFGIPSDFVIRHSGLIVPLLGGWVGFHKLNGKFTAVVWPARQSPVPWLQSTARISPFPPGTSECSGCDDRGCWAARSDRRRERPNSGDASN